MVELFEGPDRLNLAEHVERWSGLDPATPEGAASQWQAAAYTFTRQFERAAGSLSPAEWRRVADAWQRLVDAAEGSTGNQHNEWLLRDLRLSVRLLCELGPRPGLALLDPHRVLARVLDAMPMPPGEARRRGPVWRDLPRAEILELRKIRQLLNCVRPIAGLLRSDARRVEWEEWREVEPLLP